MPKFREIDEDDEDIEDLEFPFHERLMTIEERDQFIKKHCSIDPSHRVCEEKKNDTMILLESGETPHIHDVLLENILSPIDGLSRNPQQEIHKSVFGETSLKESALLIPMKATDSTLPCLLDNLEISHQDSSVDVFFPERFGDFHIKIDGIPRDWNQEELKYNIRDIMSTTLHTEGLTYRKRKRGGSYYIYQSLFDSPEVQSILHKAIPRIIDKRHSYFVLTESISPNIGCSILEDFNGTSLFTLLNNPFSGIQKETQFEIKTILLESIRKTLLKEHEDSSQNKENLSHMQDEDLFFEAKSLGTKLHTEVHTSFVSAWRKRYPELQRMNLTSTWMNSSSDVYFEALDQFINTPKMELESSYIMDLHFAFLDRQSSGLESWEKSPNDTITTKKDNFILRTSICEESWLTSLILNSWFVDNYCGSETKFLSEDERKSFTSEESLEIVKRRVGRFLRWKWNDWSQSESDIRNALEFLQPNRLNALGAFNKFLSESDEGKDIFNPKSPHTLSEIESNREKRIAFLELACKGHRTFREGVLKPLKNEDITGNEAIIRWWQLMNQKPENYIGYSIMRHLQEGYQNFVAVYVPNQGVWIAGKKDDSNWQGIGSMGIGQGKGNTRNEGENSTIWSSFHRSSPIGLPRAWVISTNEDETLSIECLQMNYDFAKVLFTSDNLDTAKSLVQPVFNHFLEDIFSEDRKESSKTCGEMILVSPDALVFSALDNPNRQEGLSLWENKTSSMNKAGYDYKTCGRSCNSPTIPDMLSYMQEILYKQAYNISDAKPILNSFSEIDIPEGLDCKSLMDIRKNDLEEYDLRRIVKALLPKLTLKGDYKHIDEAAKEISRIRSSIFESKFASFLKELPSTNLNTIDILTLKTGFLQAANLLFPIRGEIANIVESYSSGNKFLRTGGKSQQRKLWVKRAFQSLEGSANPKLRDKLIEYGLEEIPCSFETKIITDGVSKLFNNQWNQLTYLEKTRGNESLLLLSGKSKLELNRYVLLLQRHDIGALKGEAGQFISPEIDYDVQRIVKWLEEKGISESKSIWSKIQYWNEIAFSLKNPERDSIIGIKKNLGILYERIFTLFSEQPSADLEKFVNPDSRSIIEILRTITKISYVTDPRARIIGKKNSLGRPNINRQGFNLEVESSFLEQSSEHFFPFTISVLSAASPSGRQIHDNWMDVSIGSKRLLMGTSYGESSRWPYDVSYFYTAGKEQIDALLLESTSSLIFRKGGSIGTPMAINDLLSRKYQALQKGAIKMVHHLICDGKTSSQNREEPFGYIIGSINRVTYDHRIPVDKKPNLANEMLDAAIDRRKKVEDRKQVLLESASKYSWFDTLDPEWHKEEIGLDDVSRSDLIEEALKFKQSRTKPRVGLSKMWTPMLSKKWLSLTNQVSQTIDTLGGIDNEIGAKLWLYFLPFIDRKKTE